ncbi:MAG: c-type cytochrome [Candidatus Limnocylindrales bacterium]
MNELILGLVLLVVAGALALVAWRAQTSAAGSANPPGPVNQAGSATFGRARAFGALAFISGIVFVISGIVNTSAPVITYFNPTPDSVASVDRGAVIYDATCARCHGAEYHGDGPDAGTTAILPPSLVSGHLTTHSDSDIYTWIRDGLVGGMPAYGTNLTEAQRWDLVNFLRGINGQGPSPDVVPGALPSPGGLSSPGGAVPPGSDGVGALAGFGALGGIALALLGWFSAGIHRSRSKPVAHLDRPNR